MKHYTKEFRLQAARLVVEQGYSYAEVAQRFGLSAWSAQRIQGELAKLGFTVSDNPVLKYRSKPKPDADNVSHPCHQQ
jgi:transposase-like protein